MLDSQRRLEILRNAAETGDILVLGYSGGPIWVRAGKVDLGDETDRGDQALYVDELRAMVVESLVEQRGKDYFRLTGAGFTAAKKALGKINPQETSTTELVEIIKQQAESFQKPNEDNIVWKELMVRYRWIGCPKEDLALIGSLDPLLQRLNNGHTIFPPQAIQIPGAGIPPPPPYYQGKIRLSQVVNVPPIQPLKTTSPKSVEAITALKPSNEILKNDSRQTDNKNLTPKHHWSLTSLFLVTVAIAILTLLLVWHDLRK